MECDPLQTLTRRRFLTALSSLAVAAGALAGGCSRTGGNKITIRFWNGFTGPDGRTMLRIIKRFNAANPDIQVLMQRMDWATCYNKLFVAGMGGRAPELFVLHTAVIPRFARAGFLRANDDLMAGLNGVPLNDLDANVWQGAEYQGKHYGLPLDVHAMGMYYNRKRFREAGIVDAAGNPRPPTNREEFLDAATRMTKPASGGGPDQWGFVFTNWESNCYTLMRQYGGAFFTPDYEKCLLNNAENAAALQFCVDLIHKYQGRARPGKFRRVDRVSVRAKVGMAFEGIYMLADLQKQSDLDFSGAPVPQFGPHQAVWAGSHNLCLRSDLKEPQLSATWRFIKYLSDNSLDWAAGGQIPTRPSRRAAPRFKEMTVQSAFAKQIPYVELYAAVCPLFLSFRPSLIWRWKPRCAESRDARRRFARRGGQHQQSIIARDREANEAAARRNTRMTARRAALRKSGRYTGYSVRPAVPDFVWRVCDSAACLRLGTQPVPVGNAIAAARAICRPEQFKEAF